MFGTYLLYIGSFFVTAMLALKMPIRFQKKSIWDIKKRIQYILYLIYISFFPLLLASIRSSIGIDYYTYEIIFKKFQFASVVDYWSSSTGYEIGNFFLIKLGYELFGNTQGVFAIYSIITILLLVAAINYYRERLSIGISIMVMFFLLYTGTYNTVRQHLAIAIVIFSLRYIESREWLKYVILIVLATSIHSTAIIMLFAYFLYSYKNEVEYENCDSHRLINIYSYLRKFLIVVIIISPVLIGALLDYISMFPIFTRYFKSYEAESYDITTSLILKLPVYIPLLFAYKVNVKRNQINRFYYVLLLLEFELLLTSSVFKWGFRLSYYAIIAQVILVGVTVKNAADIFSKLVISAYFVLWYALQFWVLYFVWGRDGIWPYVSIFM